MATCPRSPQESQGVLKPVCPLESAAESIWNATEPSQKWWTISNKTQASGFWTSVFQVILMDSLIWAPLFQIRMPTTLQPRGPTVFAETPLVRASRPTLSPDEASYWETSLHGIPNHSPCNDRWTAHINCTYEAVDYYHLHSRNHKKKDLHQDSYFGL